MGISKASMERRVMPATKREFTGPNHIEATIRDIDSPQVVGTIRIKPSGVLWKPKGRQKFKWRSLDEFTEWMRDSSREVKK